MVRICANVDPFFFGNDRARMFKAHEGNAAYRLGPPRLEDRLPITQAYGPQLPLGPPRAVLGPDALNFTRVPHQQPVTHSAGQSQTFSALALGAAARLLLTIDFFILNLCCGYRRGGDLEDLAARLAYGSFRVWVVCVDIISGNSLHDLSCSATFSHMLVPLRKGTFHAWVIGPPLRNLEQGTISRDTELVAETSSAPAVAGAGVGAAQSLAARVLPA